LFRTEERDEGKLTGRVSVQHFYDTINVVKEPELRCKQAMVDCSTNALGSSVDLRNKVPGPNRLLEPLVRSDIFDEGRTLARHVIDENELTAILLERNANTDRGDDGLSYSHMSETLSALVAPRTILIQLIPPLTVWAVFALQTCPYPLFVQCEDFAKRLPPHFISIADAYRMVSNYQLHHRNMSILFFPSGYHLVTVTRVCNALNCYLFRR